MPKLKPGTIVPDDVEDAAITLAARSDPGSPPLTEEDFARMRPMRGRGRPAGSGTKTQITMRIDTDIIEAFKRDGDGWQSRMNGVLRKWLIGHR